MTYLECFIEGKLDAGLLREYIAIKHSDTLTFGGSLKSHSIATKLCKTLSKLIDESLEFVVKQAIDDGEILSFNEEAGI
tara:strand:- start:423 stop:659 length:237 start_codon:yes stop_codon:yes gene_type:complete